jgi:phosphohistidine phosphatase
MVMKTLLILRHGKAEGYNVDGDKARDLADRGVRDAHRMGTIIEENISKLDLIVSSDAARAVRTARLAALAAQYSFKIDQRDELYVASSSELLSAVKSLPADVSTVLLVGHNPGLEELVTDLTGRQIVLATCGLVKIELPGSWKEADVNTGTLAGSWAPKAAD